MTSRCLQLVLTAGTSSLNLVIKTLWLKIKTISLSCLLIALHKQQKINIANCKQKLRSVEITYYYKMPSKFFGLWWRATILPFSLLHSNLLLSELLHNYNCTGCVGNFNYHFSIGVCLSVNCAYVYDCNQSVKVLLQGNLVDYILYCCVLFQLPPYPWGWWHLSNLISHLIFVLFIYEIFWKLGY